MIEGIGEVNVNAGDMSQLLAQLGNVAARAYAEGRFGEWGAIKGAMAFMEAARELAAADARAKVAEPEKPKRGRKPKSNGADIPASVADVAGARG